MHPCIPHFSLLKKSQNKIQSNKTKKKKLQEKQRREREKHRTQHKFSLNLDDQVAVLMPKLTGI